MEQVVKEEYALTLQKIVMPKLGESVTEGTINSWLVKVGDHVNKYDPIAEVMTDKVNAEVPSSFSGTIKEIVVQEGDTVSVDDLICYIETTDKIVEREETIDKIPPNETLSQVDTTEQTPEKGTLNAYRSKKARFSPAVMRLAAEHEIDLTSVQGTGLGGRITRKDVLAIIESGQITTKQSKQDHTSTQPVSTFEKLSFSGKDREIPVTGVRKMIAENMVRSKHEIPHAWMTVEADVTNLVQYRDKVKQSFIEKKGFPITYFAFFIYAVSKALQEYPALNSTWAGDKIIERNDVNISIAVAKENELFVPVIKHADEKSVKGIARTIHELAQKTHNGTLSQADISGGTFTVNNTGTFGSVSSMGIINYPQAAILQVETIVKRPVIINDMFAARDMVNLSLSLDHRILDGLVCGRFLARVKDILENIDEETVDL